MGMFDYLISKYPLEVVPDDGLFQTKDTPSQGLSTYELREDGSLWRSSIDLGEVDDAPETWIPEPMTGPLYFYGPIHRGSGAGSGWIEYKATMVDGVATEVIVYEHQPAGSI